MSEPAQNYMLQIVSSIGPAIARAHAAILELGSQMSEQARRERKRKREALWFAKRCACSIRRDLVHAAGCTFRGGDFSHACAALDTLDEQVTRYLELCRKADVTPPIVRVPRSLRRRLGRTIGGGMWDTSPVPDLVTA